MLSGTTAAIIVLYHLLMMRLGEEDPAAWFCRGSDGPLDWRPTRIIAGLEGSAARLIGSSICTFWDGRFSRAGRNQARVREKYPGAQGRPTQSRNQVPMAAACPTVWVVGLVQYLAERIDDDGGRQR